MKNHLPTAEHWDAQADDWARWARAEGHDSYWSFHGARFHSLVPPPNPGAIALDLACGEGRVARRLQADGWVVVASDYGRRLCGWTRSSGIDATACASAAAVPFRSSSIDLVTVFMGFHDFDDPVMDTAFDEVARILKPGGSAVIGINHPVHSFLDAQRVGESGLHFSVKHSYFGPVAYENVVRREGLELRFRGVQRPLQAYLDGFMSAGLLLDRFEEVTVPAEPERGVSKASQTERVSGLGENPDVRGPEIRKTALIGSVDLLTGRHRSRQQDPGEDHETSAGRNWVFSSPMWFRASL